MLPIPMGRRSSWRMLPTGWADWTGQRIDSKDPTSPETNTLPGWSSGAGTQGEADIASDAMDVEDILGLHAYFMGTIAPGLTPKDFNSAADLNDPAKWTPNRRIRFSAGWARWLTNDFRGCHPPTAATDSIRPVLSAR